MKNMVMICAVCIFLSLTAPAKAGTITQDFDTIGASLGEGGHLIDQLSGLTFTGAYIAEEGGSPYAFWSNSPPDPPHDKAHSGQYTVTDKKGDSGPITVSFATPVYDLSFYAMDIDTFGGKDDILTAQVFDSSHTLLNTITITYGQAGYDTGDCVATFVDFTSINNISSLEMRVETGNSFSGNYSGWALDDLSYTPVPVPGAIWLLGSGLIGLAAFGGRRGKS